ncbi:MAG TPA: outer membrane beta-barrel protein [Terriglobales bacterium]|nr:outer membrane beta-barrel protein [Terriglobales bacterium]
MLKQLAASVALSLALIAGAAAQGGVNPPVATNVPPPANSNSSAWGGASELYFAGSFQAAKATVANGVNVSTTNVAGAQIAYRYHVTDYNAVEVRVAFAQPTQTYGPTVIVHTRAYEMSMDYAWTVPSDGFFRPFLLGGWGILHYTPLANGSTPGSITQNKATLIYGGGVDAKLKGSLSLRLEYRGLVYRVPDFGQIGISKWNHMPEPDAGIVWHF